jgi:hypothetical protein
MRWFDQTHMTHARWVCYQAMEVHDEGLGPRAYRTLLQIGDKDTRVRPDDAAWLWDDEMGPPMVEWLGVRDGYTLSAFGQKLYAAANDGDVTTIIRLTPDSYFGRSELLN